uniref:RAB6-interacting golgin n=1 Tax=Pectinophora gossypiella TaxID=13191 RepID=A0A1E1WQW7_PECGO
MASTFTGFSEEDLKRIKLGESSSMSAQEIDSTNIKKIDRIGSKPKRVINQYKLPILQKQDSDDNLDIMFDKCKLSIKAPTSPNDVFSNNNEKIEDKNELASVDIDTGGSNEWSTETPELDKDAEEESKGNNTHKEENNHHIIERKESTASIITLEIRKKSSDTAPDLVRGVDNYSEDDLAAHRVKLQELQLQQKLMEEQNKKRKEMLAKALADRTKQTEEEVQRLEKIKKELQVLDGQFSQDVSVLRKKIDQACLSYAEAEKHYLKVEKEFLHAKIQLQKEKEKKELLTEHLCALITHNETRKAQKLETLMLELATEKKIAVTDSTVNNSTADDDDKPVIVDGVDQKTGKMVEFTNS